MTCMQNRIFPCEDQCLYENLSHFDIVEKVQSFQTGGWENAKKGYTRSKIHLLISGLNLYFRICQIFIY